MSELEEKFKGSMYKCSKAVNTENGIVIETMFDESAKQCVKIAEEYAISNLEKVKKVATENANTKTIEK